MRKYSFHKKWEKLLTPDIVTRLTAIHEYRGMQSLFLEAHADELKELIEIAKAQSAKSSSRMEGIIISDDRLKKLVQDKTIPKNRNEQEIAGYRNVLNTIHENYEYVPVKPALIQQLHKDLYRFQGSDAGGKYKCADNVITETDAEGNQKVRFHPVASWETSEAMEALCKAYEEALLDEKMDSLVLIPMFILDFLCIYPFNEGNYRLSRLLTLLLLHKNGYIVGKYISIEKIIEGSKDTYYEALWASSQNWYENENDYAPFVNYMLGVILDAYKEFFSKVRLLTTAGITKGDRIESVIQETAGTITKAEIMRKCPGISQITVQRTLIDLQNAGKIKKIGGGRYTKYIWSCKREENGNDYR